MPIDRTVAMDALDHFKAFVAPTDAASIPPSAFLAALRLVAEYEGWDWDRANANAVLFGTADCWEITDNLHTPNQRTK